MSRGRDHAPTVGQGREEGMASRAGERRERAVSGRDLPGDRPRCREDAGSVPPVPVTLREHTLCPALPPNGRGPRGPGVRI